MSIRNVWVLLAKDLIQGPKSFIFVWILVAPVIMSLVVSLVFGTLFSETPKLAIVDEGSSRVTDNALRLSSVKTTQYENIAQMVDAVERGAEDVGVVLPVGFDGAVTNGEQAEVSVYTWGQSLAKNRLVIRSTVLALARDAAGQQAPIDIEAVTIGDKESIPWADRLLPFLVMYAVIVAGSVLTGTAIVAEKEQNTMVALVTTPTTINDVFASKGLLGAILGLLMGIIMLVLNQAFGAQPLLLIGVLALGAVMAAEVGLILGAVTKDVTTLFAVYKSIGILLFAPAIVYMFPQVPQWIGKMFPTYYLVQPVFEVSQHGAEWGDIATNVSILAGIDVLLIAVVALIVRRTPQYAI